MTSQGEFDFERSRGKGYEQWLAVRKLHAADLARQVHLPLNRPVEVWLRGGIRRRGKLHLKEELLFISEDALRHLELRVDRLTFTYGEMESCIALD